MTVEQKILALDAACCASEGAGIPPALRAAINLLQEELTAHFTVLCPDKVGECADYESFNHFLTAQREAVQALAHNPAVFGAE